MWKVSVEDRDVSSLMSLILRVELGQIVSFSYEERSLEDKASSDEDESGE